MSILLLVGNGLTLDFCANVLGQQNALDTRAPLGWSFSIQAADDAEVFDVLSELEESVVYVRALQPQLNDFELIRELSGISSATTHYAPLVDRVRATNGGWVGLFETPWATHPLDVLGTILRYQLRLFLNAAFLHFHDKYCAQSATSIAQWQWFDWLGTCAPRLGLVCSFNYDLVVESTLALASDRRRRYVLDGTQWSGPIAIFKPHGSINFAVSPRAIRAGNIYEGGNIFERNDAPVVVVPHARLHESRLMPDLVLPLEYSQITEFQSIACGYQRIAASGQHFRHCVIAGLSYWEYDQPEINQILSCLSREAVITVINPSPPPALMAYLHERFSEEKVRTCETLDQTDVA